jgi:predicted ATPase
MLERLYVDNFKCLVNFECRFGRSQLILGPNGSGKTTLFDVIAILRDFCVWGLQADSAFGGLTRTRWQNVPEQTFELDVLGNEGGYTFRLVIDSWGNPARPRVVKEELFFSGKPVFRFAQGEVHLFNDRHEDKVQYPFDWHRSALATVTERPENTKLSWFKRWLGGLLFISPDPHQMFELAEMENLVPTRNLSNFAAWYRHLRQEQARGDQMFLEDLRQAIPGFQGMDLREAGMGHRYLMLNFAVNGEPGRQHQPFGQFFKELSDGQRVLIGLYAVLHFAVMNGATVFLDEPDNFVALPEIQPWLDKLLDAVEDDSLGAQAFIISHHPELLNRMANQGGVALERPGGRHTRARAFNDPAQTGLSPAELVVRGWDHE